MLHEDQVRLGCGDDGRDVERRRRRRRRGFVQLLEEVVEYRAVDEAAPVLLDDDITADTTRAPSTRARERASENECEPDDRLLGSLCWPAYTYPLLERMNKLRIMVHSFTQHKQRHRQRS